VRLAMRGVDFDHRHACNGGTLVTDLSEEERVC
jgi:hypothetical protein